MSALELFISEVEGRLHCAITDKGVLTDLYMDPLAQTAPWGSLYLGKVTKIDKNLDAAIVDLGNGLSGLLGAKHIHFANADPSEQRTGINDLVKPGQMLLVQIKSEARNYSEHERQKLPRLTTKLYIHGQHLIYCPIAAQVTISRGIENEATLVISSKLKGRGGWIMQRNAERATEAEIMAEADFLQNEWQIISAERDASGDKPRLLRIGPNAIARALFDYGDAAFAHIHAAHRRIFDLAAAWCAKYNPALATSKRLKLYKPEHINQKLFDIHEIYAGIEQLQEKLVPLPSGGSLIIEPTHAMVVIDVNQGSSGSTMEANLEAAHEVVRQIHLRNLSGAILVDFIGLSHRNDRARLLETLEKITLGDMGIMQIHGFTRLGIIEIARKRRTGMYFEKISR